MSPADEVQLYFNCMLLIKCLLNTSEKHESTKSWPKLIKTSIFIKAVLSTKLYNFVIIVVTGEC